VYLRGARGSAFGESIVPRTIAPGRRTCHSER